MYFGDLGMSSLFSENVLGNDTFSSSIAKIARKFDRQIGQLLQQLNTGA